ncbi:MAG: KEOPS complex kinase/ATPase Bud32 [Candidatus Micrarchaeia archaeon]
MKAEKMAEGAEAIIYESEFLGISAIIKERIEKKYRNKTLDLKLRKERTLTEARILAFASSNNINTPFVFLIKDYSIIMNKIKGTNLNILMKYKKIEPSIFKDVAIQLAKMHNLNIIHGDFTPANIMVDNSNNTFNNYIDSDIDYNYDRSYKVYIIDFGLAEITTSVEEKALDILLMKRSLSKKEFEIFIDEYKKNSNSYQEIFKRLNEIELRGRYQVRSLL